MDKRNSAEIQAKRKADERLNEQGRQIEDVRLIVQQDRAKHRDRFLKVNDALLSLEHHMEQGNKKLDKIVTAEIQSRWNNVTIKLYFLNYFRRQHEKSLLGKVDDVEVRLNNYLNNLTKTIDEVKSGVGNIKIPVLDTDAVNNEYFEKFSYIKIDLFAASSRHGIDCGG